jgi:hypothetical protein
MSCQEAQDTYLDICCPALAQEISREAAAPPVETTENNDTTDNYSDHGLSKAAKWGIGIGVTLAAVACGFIIYVILTKKAKKSYADMGKELGSSSKEAPSADTVDASLSVDVSPSLQEPGSIEVSPKSEKGG